jgi:hypothetical protein
MKAFFSSVAIMAAVMGAGAQAADYGPVARDRSLRSGVPTQAIVRLADQGLGYSVVHQNLNPALVPHRVHVTCTIDESFAVTFCPTVNYVASCPRATIACR